MKKFFIFTLLLTLSACSGEVSSSLSSNTESSTSSSLSSSSSTSSSSSSSSSKTFVELDENELKFEENSDGTAYLIKEYKSVKHSYITLPSSYNDKPVIGIVNNAFFGSEFKDVKIPDSYTEFTTSAFSGVSTIMNYFVSDTHPLYTSVDGVLYTNDETCLFAYPTGRRDTYEVKDGTTKILSGSFQYTNVINVVLPETVNDIQSRAFYSAKRLKSINIPSNVEEIKESTFDTCNALKDIKFSEGIEKIGYRAFWRCYSISSINFPKSLKEIGTSAFEGMTGIEHLQFSEGLEYIGDFAFAYNEYIEEITFPSTLKRIGKYAFMQNYRLKELNLVEGIEVLEEGAFFYYEKLETVKLPSTLKEIGFDCFSSSVSSFKEIILDKDNQTYCLVDDILYTKDMKQLVLCPATKEFENGTFRVLDGVEKIGDHAFYNCASLKNVVLPNSLKEIGKTPFYVCRINSIEYLGTMEEFKTNVTTAIWQYGNESEGFINIAWYYTNYDNGIAFTSLTCSDGVLDLTSY